MDETAIDVFPGDGSILPDEADNTLTEEDGEASLLAAEISNNVSTRSVTIYPLVVCVETGDVYRLNSVKRTRVWTISTQSDSLKLTPEAVTALANEAITLLSGQSSASEYTWGVVGWNVESVLDLTAQRPLRVESKPYYPQSKEVYEMSTTSVSNQYSTLTLAYNFGFPPKPNDYYYIGFTGAFYFRYTSGKEGSLMLSPGVMMNY